MNLCLLQIADSALPISGYTHSWGLEAAIARRLVHDPESLERWTGQWLRTSLGPLEGVLVASACRAAHAGDRPAAAGAEPSGRRLDHAPFDPRRQPGDGRATAGARSDLGLVRRRPWRRSCRNLSTSPTAGTTRSPSGCSAPSPARARGRADRLPAPGGPRYDRRRASAPFRSATPTASKFWPISTTTSASLAAELVDRDPETAGAGCPFYEVLCDEQTRLYARMFRS